MFDVRPVDQSGVLDWDRINRVGQLPEAVPGNSSRASVARSNFSKPIQGEEAVRAIVDAPQVSFRRPVRAREYREEVLQLGKPVLSEDTPMFYQAYIEHTLEQSRRESFASRVQSIVEPEAHWLEKSDKYAENSEVPLASLVASLRDRRPRKLREDPQSRYRKKSRKDPHIRWEEKLGEWRERMVVLFRGLFQSRFVTVALLFGFLVIGGVEGYGFFQKGIRMKGEVLGVSQDGYKQLTAAVDGVKNKQFDRSGAAFGRAYDSFSQASEMLGEWNSILVDVTRFIPGLSKLSSGKNVVEAGKHISLAGQELNEALKAFAEVKNPLDKQSKDVSFLDLFNQTHERVSAASKELASASEVLEKVKIEDIPEDKRGRFIQAKSQLPAVREGMQVFLDHGHIFTELLGGNGPRKYLFLFQNNHEMRPTGGFIGSYGLLDISNGRIRNFFVDGIFNPDGQLKENIVPPQPIQKVSAAWSLHDSNWFPDFPQSAEKAIFFYEKTGGPTVDGVITLTPLVIRRLLEVTGPVEMPTYGVTITADNFMEVVQYEVEVDYDKKENKPKQILADLAPILLDMLFNASDAKTLAGAVRVFEEGLNEKHILMYSRNREIASMIDEQGWSGRILDASKDYLSVVNTNINGYKTDGVIDETIHHEAQIRDDGSVINTVTITRKHNGGFTSQDWWNRVNANYMRVYVPKGSKLLSAEGHTREKIEAPLDYDKLGFKRDQDIENEENNTVIDEATGTRISEENGKTVFGNWVYVSPQETVTVKYTYLLPFQVWPEADREDGLDSYAAVYQKQAGSEGSRLRSSISFPRQFTSVWQSSENLVPYEGGLRMDTDLRVDRFIGIAFSRE